MLTHHPQIRQAIAISQTTAQGSQSLIAYLVKESSEQPLNSGNLRSYLQQRLPDYSLPSGFVVLDKLPLTPTGKVDRRRLASPGYTQKPWLNTNNNYVAPQTRQQTLLVNLWSQFLPVESVGIDDNFFDLGGDSIIAIQIAAKTTQAGFPFSPQQIMQQGTIAQLTVQSSAPLYPKADPGTT